MTATTLALLGVLIFAGAGSLKSYVLSTAGPGGPVIKWPVNTSIVLPLQLGTHGQGTLLDGSANFDVVAAEAAGLWDDYLGSNVRFIPTQNGVGPSGTTYNATANQVLFSDTINGMAFGGGVLAVTTTYFNRLTGTISRSDVTFNNQVSWNSFRGARSGSGTTYDLRRVAVHELGHALGLSHPDAQMVAAVMNSTYSDTIEVPQQDDINGVQADYGFYNPLPDLISLGREIGGTRVHWQEVFPGAVYRVQVSDYLAGGWQEASGTVTADGNGLIEFLDSASPAPTQRFYRLIPPP